MKKIAVGIILIISLVIINNLVRSIINLWQKQELVVRAQDDLGREKELHTTLKEQYVQVKKKDFVEKEARNKLFFVKPGEEVVILPQDQVLGRKDTIITSVRKKKQKSPIEEWLSLFALAGN